MSARRPHLSRTHLSTARRAALVIVGSATALGMTAAFAGSAAALSPVPSPDLPVIAQLSDPEPPVDPPSDPTPQVPVGPAELATPTTLPEPLPMPPEAPGDLAIDEVDDPELPDPQPEPGDGGGVPEGPGDLTAVPDPTHPDDQPEPTVPESTVPEATVPEATDSEPEVLGEAESAAAETLAFTGNDLGLVATGAGLLAAGGLAAGVATLARRRRAAETGGLA